MKKRFFAILISLAISLNVVTVSSFAENKIEENRVCSCNKLCTEGSIDLGCAACLEGLNNCSYNEADEYKVCRCDTLCTEESINSECEVCNEDYNKCSSEKESILEYEKEAGE